MKTKSAVPPGGEPSGGVQGQPRPWMPVSVPEIRRLWGRLVLAVPHTVHHLLAWSQWRRWQQTIAPYSYDTRRAALAGAVAA